MCGAKILIFKQFFNNHVKVKSFKNSTFEYKISGQSNQ